MPDEHAHGFGPEGRDGLAAENAVRPPAVSWSLPSMGLARLLIVSDAVALGLALLVAYSVGARMGGRPQLSPERIVAFLVVLPIWLLGACLYGLYAVDSRRALRRTVDEWANLVHLVVIGIVAFLLVAITAGIESPSTGQLVAFGGSAVALLIVGRAAVRSFARRTVDTTQTVVIVGAGEVGQLVARKLLRHPEYGIDLVGFVDTPPRHWRPDIAHVPVLGGVEDLAAIVRTLDVDRVIVAFSKANDLDTLARVRQLIALNVDVDVVPRMFEMIGPNAGLPDVEGIPLVTISPRAPSTASLRMKRAIDVAVASFGLVLAAPLFLWAAWRIPRESPGSVFFRQTRLGANMREFTMLKFRTMTMDADQASHHAYVERTMNGELTAGAGDLYKLDRHDVVTPTGRWLRRTSLDELPQLVNVLQGSMSLVGPRPCLAYETEYFAAHHYERFLAPAGITGLWQVTARAHASFAEALEMDVVYVRDWSLALDLSLIVRTPVALLRQRKSTV